MEDNVKKKKPAVDLERLQFDARLFRSGASGGARTEVVFMRLTKAEKAALVGVLQPRGWPTAQFLRAVALDVMDAHDAVPVVEPDPRQLTLDDALKHPRKPSRRGERIKQPAKAARRGRAKGSTKPKRATRRPSKKLSRRGRK